MRIEKRGPSGPPRRGCYSPRRTTSPKRRKVAPKRAYNCLRCETREKRIFSENERIGNSCQDSTYKTLNFSLDLG